MRKGLIAGVVLILIGAYFLLRQVFFLPEGIGLVMIGALFLVARGILGWYGLTIPGCIVAALGAAEVAASLDLLPRGMPLQGAIGLFLLAAAFFAMHVIDGRRLGRWPLIPGLCLTAFGALAVFAGSPDNWRPLLRDYWPVILIVIGVFSLVGAMARRRDFRAPEQAAYAGAAEPPPQAAPGQNTPPPQNAAEQATAPPQATTPPDGPQPAAEEPPPTNAPQV